jgi:hypothetical protein
LVYPKAELPDFPVVIIRRMQTKIGVYVVHK